MRDEVRRINKLVAEGKLTPEDAADLIDAFYASEREEQDTGPTPPPNEAGDSHRDPFKALIDQIEKLTKEGRDSVDWQEFSKHARDGARKGIEFLKSGIDDLSKGKVNLFGNHETKEVNLPLTVAEGKLLKVENLCGDVRIVGGSPSGTATAKARFRGANLEDARKKAAEYTLIIEESEHQVLIRQPDVSGLEVDLDLQIAGHANVEIRSQRGDVDVKDTGMGCRVTGRSGDISLTGLNGAVEISSESGDIKVKRCDGSGLGIENKSGNISIESATSNVNVRSSSGDITLDQVSGKVVAVEAVSGDVKVDLTQPVTGSVSIRTVSGDASVAIADGSDCRVSLSALRGDVSCEVELSDEAKTQRQLTGKLGSGAGTLDVSAVTGNVSLMLRDHAAVV